MYRVTKALNHNSVLAVKENSSQEYLILGKGIGFGKKAFGEIDQSILFPMAGICSYADCGGSKGMYYDD